ncbi:MAG: chemotaxis response regulator protein-glutamate methylesterase [bacterium]
MPSRQIKVLVVDDSLVVRKVVTDALRTDPEIDVVGTAGDPYIARDKILELKPDVITLDIEMPKMDGLTFLKLIMRQHPLPVIIMSSLTQAGSRIAMDALESGAVDVLLKPGSSVFLSDMVPDLIMKIKAAANARSSSFLAPSTRNSSSGGAGGISGGTTRYHSKQVILLGASTGGTEALRDVFSQLPGDLPGICIVQHIPGSFSAAFAERLNSVSAIEVREARDGDVLRRGLALVAPGDFHMLLHKRGEQGYMVQVKQGPKIMHHRPSVDLLFESAAPIAGARAVAGIFTGMGSDGANGLLALRKAGARTFAQDEKTCVVYGMPRVAVELGAAERVVPLPGIPAYIVKAAAIAAGSTPMV